MLSASTARVLHCADRVMLSVMGAGVVGVERCIFSLVCLWKDWSKSVFPCAASPLMAIFQNRVPSLTFNGDKSIPPTLH